MVTIHTNTESGGGYMQELIKELSDQFNVEIATMVPFRDGFILNTGDSKKMLAKRIPYSTNRIEFIHSVKEHLHSAGFNGIDRFKQTSEGMPFADLEGEVFTVTDIFTGRECNFDNQKEIISAVKALAQMHTASKGFLPDKAVFSKNELGKIPDTFDKRLSDIKKMKKNAKKGRTKFDYLFLDYADYFIDLAEEAIGELRDSNYESLVKEGMSEGCVCHHDFTHNNIILGNEDTHIINFDSCCMELKIYDLANLIRRKMRKCGWDYNEAKILIREYESMEKLSKDDLDVLMVMLKFPQKFWRVANKFYNSRQSWSEKVYVGKLYEVIEEIEPHKRMIENLEQQGMS